MSIEARVNKLGLNGLIENGIHVHSKELLIIASQVNVHQFGLAKVLVRINGDSFKELAQKMMEANSSDAIKAFSAVWETSTTLADFLETGFPNQFFCDSWVVGFWRADHEEHFIGLGGRSYTLVEAVPGPLRAQGAAADVPALRGRVDWTRRSQECSADGGAACTWRL